MRVAYVVDVHGRPDAVADVIAATGEVDVLLVGGDITTAGSVEDAERAVQSWRSLAPVLLAVSGNMDSPEIDARLVELGVSVDGRGVVIDGVGFFGVSAAPLSPLRTPYEVSEESLGVRARMGAACVASARIRVFCPHAPPYATACDRLASGEHVGSRAVRAFVEREQPDVVLCGHIHESRGRDTIGRSEVINPGPVAGGHYALLELGDSVQVVVDGARSR